MRQNNETMSVRHTPHSTHCLKRLNSLNCLIKSVKTLQTVIKLTIVFLLCGHKLFNFVFLDLSLTLNITIIYGSFIVRRWYFSLCSLAVNICSSYLFTSLKFTGYPAVPNSVKTAQETHVHFVILGSEASWVSVIRPRGGPSSPNCILCVCLLVHMGRACMATVLKIGSSPPLSNQRHFKNPYFNFRLVAFGPLMHTHIYTN